MDNTKFMKAEIQLEKTYNLSKKAVMSSYDLIKLNRFKDVSWNKLLRGDIDQIWHECTMVYEKYKTKLKSMGWHSRFILYLFLEYTYMSLFSIKY